MTIYYYLKAMIDFNNAEFIKLSAVSEEYANDVKDLFIRGEEVVGVYKAIRDYVVFTNKRILVVNIQGLTGKKKDYTSLPFSRIQCFSIETAGVFDLDSELELWFSGLGKITLEFTGRCNIKEIGRHISECMMA